MKKNAALREFKKLKSQINQIEEIAHHSKVGALIEQETSIRKKKWCLKAFRTIKLFVIDMKNF